MDFQMIYSWDWFQLQFPYIPKHEAYHEYICGAIMKKINWMGAIFSKSNIWNMIFSTSWNTKTSNFKYQIL